MTVYNAYCAWKRTRNTPGANEYAFCRKNFLSSQTLLNIEDIKMQLIVSIADAGLLLLDPTQKTALNRYITYRAPIMPFLHYPYYLIAELTFMQSSIRRSPASILHHPRRIRYKQQQRRHSQCSHCLELLSEALNTRGQRLAERCQQPSCYTSPDLSQ